MAPAPPPQRCGLSHLHPDYTDGPITRAFVLGTKRQASVVLPDGTSIALGGEVYGGGGYLYADAIGGYTGNEAVLERAEHCAEGPYNEVAGLQYIRPPMSERERHVELTWRTQTTPVS